MKFTIEHDLTMKNINNKHHFEIYRKPTTTDCIIDAHSFHPKAHKLAFFHTMLNRLTKLPLEDNAIQKEIKILEYIAQQNDYDPKIITQLYYKKKETQPNRLNIHKEITLNTHTATRRKTTYITTTYLGNISNNINKLFNKTNITFAYQNRQNLKHKIHNDNSKIPIYNHPGIYKISCNTCHKFYIGQTGRNFNIRFKEHTRDSENNPSTFFQHLKTEKHDVKPINEALKVLHITQKGAVMTVLEEIEIFLHAHSNPQNLLNEKTDLKHKKYIENFIDIIKLENG